MPGQDWCYTLFLKVQRGVPQMLLWVGGEGGAGVLCSQCFNLFSSGGKWERTQSEASSPPWPLSICLQWSLSLGRCGRILSHSPPLPGLLLYMEDLSDFWFGWGPMRMWDSSIKYSKQKKKRLLRGAIEKVAKHCIRWRHLSNFTDLSSSGKNYLPVRTQSTIRTEIKMKSWTWLS